MTICPECGADFDTVAEVTELPVQVLEQSCPECHYDVQVAIINYPNGQFSVVAPAMKGDTCHCGRDAMIRLQRVGGPVGSRCAEHMHAHREAALGLRRKL